MNRANVGMILGATLAALIMSGCRHSEGEIESAPPPDARRPELKSESELAADREARIRSGEVAVNEPPALETRRAAPVKRPEKPIQPKLNSIRSDILMVNNKAMSVAEILYPLWDWIEETRTSQTPRGFLEILKSRISEHVRNEIGSMLVYEKAYSALPEERHQMLEDAVDRELDKRISHSFGDSRARFEAHLHANGLSIDQAREIIKRQLMVSSYTHDILAPQIRIRRDELLAHYRENITRYRSDETRELRLIAAPFERFLPGGVTAQTATKSALARAKLQAMRHIREAYDKLAERDFAAVAREYSRGVHAADGGSWGAIGQPLRAPLDVVTSPIFELAEGAYTEPIQTEAGWYIAQCGKINAARQTPFTDVQDELRQELETRRFAKLASDYIYRLAERATISDLEAFVDSAVRRAVAGPVGGTESDSAIHIE